MQPRQTTAHKNVLWSLRLKLVIKGTRTLQLDILNEYSILTEQILTKSIQKEDQELSSVSPRLPSYQSSELPETTEGPLKTEEGFSAAEVPLVR